MFLCFIRLLWPEWSLGRCWRVLLAFSEGPGEASCAPCVGEEVQGAPQRCTLRDEGCRRCAAIMCVPELLGPRKEFLLQELGAVWEATSARGF